ncbi:hypothetical protein TTHERM_001122701 (macronuclear) [Tetrahymena thermophila SB210]|uniref:Uncharacterized protein n=1 Tax=Tetrahymena thermophila (strain SB210) TaxID=312017 RepID=W7X849_TETTS|nr:hypothetical protein TTHERM_001122701 [Tetrahymena thermophila SB210]EWS73522.1 hypothetical protein TTHERM_001122701 [Tetrahymena thermophila SB210]|eukprot:XP_012653947.1 hypothetical protein TTHERM_001122701 [Tetrahymena thermophila SB210]
MINQYQYWFLNLILYQLMNTFFQRWTQGLIIQKVISLILIEKYFDAYLQQMESKQQHHITHNSKKQQSIG